MILPGVILFLDYVLTFHFSSIIHGGGLNFLSEDDGLKEMGRIKTLHWSIIFLLLTDLGDCLF
jgi:hypothetical protein